MAQTTASLDAEIELKKRSRRRLVGAAALALLAAVVLPMVMNHEPKPVGQDIQVRIPSQDAGGFASRILPTKPTATPLPPTEIKIAPAEPAQAAKPEVAKAEPPKVEAKVEAPKPETPKLVPKAETPKPEAAATAPTKVEKTVEEARAAAALAGGEQWIVRLGAYKEAANVKILAAKLKQLRVPSYTENFASANGARTRVCAGPFPSRAAAENAQARIKTIGVDGSVAQK
jgi:DedD protein